MALTYKNKYNKKYGFKKDKSHSIENISKTTGYKLSGLKTIYSKGKGAFYSNPQSVRPQVNQRNNGEWVEYTPLLIQNQRHTK